MKKLLIFCCVVCALVAMTSGQAHAETISAQLHNALESTCPTVFSQARKKLQNHGADPYRIAVERALKAAVLIISIVQKNQSIAIENPVSGVAIITCDAFQSWFYENA